MAATAKLAGGGMPSFVAIVKQVSPAANMPMICPSVTGAGKATLFLGAGAFPPAPVVTKNHHPSAASFAVRLRLAGKGIHL